MQQSQFQSSLGKFSAAILSDRIEQAHSNFALINQRLNHHISQQREMVEELVSLEVELKSISASIGALQGVPSKQVKHRMSFRTPRATKDNLSSVDSSIVRKPTSVNSFSKTSTLSLQHLYATSQRYLHTSPSILNLSQHIEMPNPADFEKTYACSSEVRLEEMSDDHFWSLERIKAKLLWRIPSKSRSIWSHLKKYFPRV